MWLASLIYGVGYFILSFFFIFFAFLLFYYDLLTISTATDLAIAFFFIILFWRRSTAECNIEVRTLVN
jgi:hypothetical protein